MNNCTGRKAKLIDGDEYDAFSGWRQYHSWKPGRLKAIKRRFNKRQRRMAKNTLRQPDMA